MRKIIKDRRGLILVISLWILALISLICIGLAHRVMINLKLAKFQKDKMQSLYIAKAAIQKAINILEKDETPETDILNELWSRGYKKDEDKYIFKEIELGDGFFTISYIYNIINNTTPVYFYGMSDEERKVNINQADRELLISFFEIMGVDDSETLSENIIYWRGGTPENYEDHYYESSEIPYSARKAPFRSIEELCLVKGFRENLELVKSCGEFFTVHTNNLININTCPSQILKAIFVSLSADNVSLGLSEKLTNNIIDFRNGADDQDASDDDVAINSNAIKTVLTTGLNDIKEIDWINNQVFPFTAMSNLFRIEVLASLKTSKIQKKITAIIERTIVQPFSVKYWHEE
ncbi:MAG: hypothetical protein ABIA97_02365 [Candidatus Omnitrophota bacterium]